MVESIGKGGGARPVAARHRRVRNTPVLHRPRRRQIRAASAGAVVLCLGSASAQAQDATWLAAPGTSSFNTGPNWSPATVPTGTASFGSSTRATVTGGNTLGTLQINSGAPAYTFTGSFVLTGQGIVNNSSFAPIFTNGGTFEFQNSAAAANAQFTNNAFVFFEDNSGAATSTITNNGAVTFSQSSTAGSANIVNNGGGSLISFADTTTAGNATITTKAGSETQFTDNATAGTARLIGSGGTFEFSGTAGPNNDNKITAGSIEGTGFFSWVRTRSPSAATICRRRSAGKSMMAARSAGAAPRWSRSAPAR
jgi:hypothetical protein